QELEPVGQPEIDVESMEKGKDWEIVAEVTLKPVVELGDYINLEVSKQDREVSDEDVEENLNLRRENAAELTLKDGKAEEGDTVVIDFKGFRSEERRVGKEYRSRRKG